MEHVLRSGSWHFAAITVDYNSTSQSNYLYDATGTLHTILDVQIPYTASIGGGDPIKQTPDHPNDNDTEDPKLKISVLNMITAQFEEFEKATPQTPLLEERSKTKPITGITVTPLLQI